MAATFPIREGTIGKVTKINTNIVLIGDFQFGKSTTFNAICDGRELSPHGVGLKTSGCPITACNLEDNEEKEYAELFWRSPKELEQFTMGIYQNEKNGIEEEYVIRQICFLVTRFNDTNELSSWRRRKRIDIDDARKIVAYPRTWSFILGTGQIKNVELSDVHLDVL